EAQSVPLGEHRDRVEVDLELVAVDDLFDRRFVSSRGGEQRRALAEVVLEARGRDHLEHPRRLVACVPYGVRDSAWLEHELARTGLEDPLAQLYANASFEHVRVLVFLAVRVHRRSERARRKWMLDQAEPAPGLLAADHEPDAQRRQVDDLSVARAEHVTSHCSRKYTLRSLK